MKEKELTPGTVFPVLGTLLFFLPERYREKLCCVTPLGQKVSGAPPPRRSSSQTLLLTRVFAPRSLQRALCSRTAGPKETGRSWFWRRKSRAPTERT